MKRYAFPAFGDRRVDHIDTPDVLRALSPIWLEKAETARRVRQRIGTVLDWAKASGFRDGENPAQDVTLTKGLPKQPKTQRHHAALPFTEVPGFVRDLREASSAPSVRFAFEFLILTATRTSEVRLAKWGEFDVEGQKWTIPAERMKPGREFNVPLPSRCVDILGAVKQLSDEFVFPGRSINAPLSDMSFLMTLRRMEVDVTGHGFRSSFRDWASERTNFSNEVCVMALAHAIADKTEAAYRRSDLFDKRRELMETWANFVTETGGAVIPLRAGIN